MKNKGREIELHRNIGGEYPCCIYNIHQNSGVEDKTEEIVRVYEPHQNSGGKGGRRFTSVYSIYTKKVVGNNGMHQGYQNGKPPKYWWRKEKERGESAASKWNCVPK